MRPLLGWALIVLVLLNFAWVATVAACVLYQLVRQRVRDARFDRHVRSALDLANGVGNDGGRAA
jgi:hypothetical protein